MHRVRLGSAVLLAVACGLTHAQQAVPLPVMRLGVAQKKAAAAVDPAKEDEKSLAAAGLKPDDGAGLLKYFKSRTLSDADLAKIRAVIQRMGDEGFDERLKASEEAVLFGPAAIGPLRSASQGEGDPEVAFRAGEVLKKIEKVPHSQVAAAAVRAVAKLAPADAAAVLLGFLPMADTPAVEDDIRTALQALVVKNGAVEPAVVAALSDGIPARRAAAAVALIAAAAKEPKGPAAAVRPKVADMLAAEKDADAKFRVGFALATVGRDPAAVGGLIDILPDLATTRGRLWQVEDVLLQVAGKNAPKAKMGPDRGGLEKAREAWKAWWDSAKSGTDLAGFTYAPRTSGKLLVLSMDNAQWGQGRLTQFGADLRAEWKANGVMAPADFQISPTTGRVWVLEQNWSRITERDTTGKILSTFNAPQGPPVGFQILPDGHFLVAYRQMVAEYDDKWKELNKYTRNQQDILGVARAENGKGPTYVITTNPTNAILRLDDQWKETGKPQKVMNLFYQPRIEVLDGDRVLVTEQQKVVEYDFTKPDQKPGEGVWSVAANNPSCVQRLANGNTLITETNANVIKEVTPEKETVWSYSPPDGMRAVRAERR